MYLDIQYLNWEAAATQPVDALVRLKAYITAVQEVRCTEVGQRRVGACGIYYSGHIKERDFGVGFVVGDRLRRRILAFTPVDERLATIRTKAKLFNISLICAHARMEEKEAFTKDVLYEYLELCPRHDGKILLGDFNARVSKEGNYGAMVREFSIQMKHLHMR